MNLEQLLKEADNLRFQSQTQQAIPLYEQVFQEADKQGNYRLAGHALHMIGVCHKMDNQTGLAINALNAAATYYSQHGLPEKEGIVMCDIGMTHDYAGDLGQAQQILESAATKLADTADKGAYGMTLAKLGFVKIKQSDNSAAQDLQRAIEVLRETSAWFFLATAIGYLGYYCAAKRDFTQALHNLEEALHIYQSHTEEDHPRRIAQTHGGIAYCHANLGNKEQARYYLRIALNMILDDNLTLAATQVLLDDIHAQETLNLLAK